MLKQKEKCPKCNQIRYMTKHHIKDHLGRKTGEVEKMCRDCHDEIEEEYRLHGMIKPAPKKSAIKFTLHSNKKWYQPMQPFYATKQSLNKRNEKFKTTKKEKCFCNKILKSK